ncbi:MAG: DUF4886 domain-containing protein [Clostridia bacterium]|nr:DUF4886 domain-containing protein [Clostridia bacterium]
MNKTRICSLLLALLMLVSLFSFVACQSEPATNENDPSSGDVADKPDEGENSDQTDKPEGTDTPDAGNEGNDEATTPDGENDSQAETPEVKKTLKVLTLGNSFSENAHSHLIQIMEAQGMEEVVLGNLVKSGCDLATHLSCAQTDYTTYMYSKFTLGEDRQVKPKFTVAKALQDEDWDMVILQQVSGKSGQPGTYGSTLTSLMNFCKQYVKPECKFGWHMTWAYQSNSNHASFANYSRNQMTMYNSIVGAVQSQIVPNSEFVTIIPAGTAIQNTRTSYIGDTLTADGYHLNSFGSYIIGYSWYKTLTGDPLTELKYLPDSLNLTEADQAIILESVNNAAATPFAVTPSQHTTR